MSATVAVCPDCARRAEPWPVRLWRLALRTRRVWGGLLFALWGVAQSDPWLLARPRLNAYAVAVAVWVYRGGQSESDREVTERQERQRAARAAGPQ